MSVVLTRPLTLVAALLMVLTTPFLAQPASAATRPSLTAVGAGAGPLRVTTVTLVGRNLGGANAVLFGRRAGSLVRRVSATRVTVRTPSGMRAGTVYVRVRTGRVWSALSARARYTFVAAPRVTRLSRASGSFAGGDLVALYGSYLTTTRWVTFAGKAATLVSRSSNRVVVRTPLGVAGAARVAVATAGGVTGSSTPSFTYGAPAAKDSAVVTPESGALTATDVQWVTGGLDPDTGDTNPWVLSLPEGAAVPEVGQSFVLKPGGATFPSGLAGTVSDVAAQVDRSVRVTVAPTALDQTLADLDVSYAGPVTAPSTAARTSPRAGAGATLETGKAAQFSVTGPTALFCRDEDGQSVSFSADLDLSVTDVDVTQHLHVGSLFSRPTYDGALTAEIQTTGKISVAAAAECKLKPAWQNAQRRVIPIGTSGMTVSFAPTLTLAVTAEGTWSIVDRTRTTFAVSAALGRSPQYSRTSRSVESRQSGALSFKVEVTGGASVQLGILDRAGLQGKAELGVAASVTAADRNVCVDGDVFAKLSVGVFLDAFVARWEADVFSVKLTIRAVHGCVLAETPVSATEPEITTTRLSDATVGAAYDEYLQTEDQRPGTWSLVHGALPAGLSLDPDSGEVVGTPTGPVGDSAVIVDFQDASGAVATTTVRLMVQPSAGIGGGDLQFTLRWSGPADLDLHVIDPSEEEIYYGHTESASGGMLDHDANAGCNGPADDDNPVENTFWPQGESPAGDYAVQVVTFDVCEGPLDWTLTVRRQGAVVLSETGNGTSDLFHVVQGVGARARMSVRGTETARQRHWAPKR